MTKLCILVIITLLLPSYSYLQVYIPQCGRTIIPSQIQYSLSNFGYIPYGHTLVGQVFKPQRQDNSELCSIENQPQIKSQGAKSFLIVKRGGCKFTEKVLNAQKLGASMVIIYDNETSTRPHIVMKNDGHGHLVSIPSVFVSGVDGMKMLSALNECSESLFLKQVFDVFQTEVVDLSLWLNLNNRQSYVLLRDFYEREYYEVIDKHVNTTVKFKVSYGCQNLWCSDEDCVGSKQNQYCMPVDRHDKNTASGSDILKESLRMYVLFDLLPQSKNDVWFKYMDKFDKNDCLEEKDVETCSYDSMKECGVSSDMIEAIKNNITATLSELSSNKFSENNVFYFVEKQADEKNIIFYPEAVINGKNFYGLFKAPEVFEMICSSLINQPKECFSYNKNKNSQQSTNKGDDLWLTVLLIILLMTVGFLTALFVYTKLIKREVNQQMSIEVNKMVQNYVNLAEQKSASQGSYNKVQV